MIAVNISWKIDGFTGDDEAWISGPVPWSGLRIRRSFTMFRQVPCWNINQKLSNSPCYRMQWMNFDLFYYLALSLCAYSLYLMLNINIQVFVIICALVNGAFALYVGFLATYPGICSLKICKSSAFLPVLRQLLRLVWCHCTMYARFSSHASASLFKF